MADTVSRNQIGANVFNMMLSFCVLLALSSAQILPSSLGVCLFIGLSSLAVSAISVALIASGLHHQVAKYRILQACSPHCEVRWRHLQYTYAIILASFNLIGFLLNWQIASSLPRPYHHSYSIASFFSLALCFSFLLTAMISINDISDDADLEQKATLIEREERHRYVEL